MINLRVDKNILVYPCSVMPAKSLQLCLTLYDPWTAVHQAPLSLGFSKKEYWSGLIFPSPWDLSNPGMERESFMSPSLAGFFFFFFFNHQCQLGSPYNGILCNKTEWTIYCCMLQNILILKSTLLNKLDKNV